MAVFTSSAMRVPQVLFPLLELFDGQIRFGALGLDAPPVKSGTSRLAW